MNLVRTAVATALVGAVVWLPGVATAAPPGTPSPGTSSPGTSSPGVAPVPGAATPSVTPSAGTSPSGTPSSPAPTGRRHDLAAIGAALEGAVGDVVELRVGIRNVGSGTKVGYDDTPTVNLVVTPPRGTTITSAPEECVRPNDKGRVYGCDFYGSFEPGQSRYATLKVRIDSRAGGAPGSAVIPEKSNSGDDNSANDAAAITVTVSGGAGYGGGLADTGAPAGPAAAIGGFAVLLGVLMAWLARRRTSTT